MINSRGRTVYIWQQKDWPNFRWAADALIEKVWRVSELHGQLAGKLGLLAEADRDRTRLASMVAEVVASSQIEGVMLNPESVRSSLARRLGIEEAQQSSEDHYVEGLVEVMLDAVSGGSKPLTEERLFDWHSALFPTGRSAGSKIVVAGWRQGDEPMQVVFGPLGKQKIHYEAPPSACIPEEMLRFIDWVNTAQLPVYIKSGIAHLWLVTIHPFDDGNGRMSRTVADMVLSRTTNGSDYCFSVSAEINREKKSYYEVLEKTQKGDLDVTSWLEWFLDCLYRALQHTEAMLHAVIRKSVYWRHFNERGVAVNERQRKVINRLWDGFFGKLTSSKYAKICHCSQDTAARDINDLIGKGMLEKGESGGRSTSYALPKNFAD